MSGAAQAQGQGATRRPKPTRFALRGVALLLLALAAPVTASAERITVFAAASLTNAMAEVEALFEDATGHEVTVSLAGSSALARQIGQGAPADIFLSANPDWMDRLEADGLLKDGTRFDLLTNTLVLIAPGSDAPTDAPARDALSPDAPGPDAPSPDAPPPNARPLVIGPDMDLAGFLDGGRLAMALVDAVPAGVYGKAALESLGLWSAIEDRVAQADNVRAALAFVALGEARGGIVYATDAVAEDRVRVIGTFPAGSHPPIVYPAAALARSDTPLAEAFLDFLRGPQARAAFARQGFAVIAE